MFTVLGAVAELERSQIGERVKAGTRNADSFKRKRGVDVLEAPSPFAPINSGVGEWLKPSVCKTGTPRVGAS